MLIQTRRILFVVAAALLAAAPLRPLAAQAGRASIDPGMTREQVLERLGKPVGERSAGGFTYLFYPNGCERRCGMHDLVVLQDDGVTDAIFRSRTRRYTGTSSSPSATDPSPAARDADATLDVGGNVEAGAPAPARRQAPRGAAARATTPATPTLRIDAPRGGIVTGGDVSGGARPDAAPRPVGAPGNPTARGGDSTAAADSASDASGSRGVRTLPGAVRVPTLPQDTTIGRPAAERDVRTMPGPVRVPTLPQDTTVGRPVGERNVRTMPGPVRVPTLPQDTLIGRDSAARRVPPPVRRPPADAPTRTP